MQHVPSLFLKQQIRPPACQLLSGHTGSGQRARPVLRGVASESFIAAHKEKTLPSPGASRCDPRYSSSRREKKKQREDETSKIFTKTKKRKPREFSRTPPCHRHTGDNIYIFTYIYFLKTAIPGKPLSPSHPELGHRHVFVVPQGVSSPPRVSKAASASETTAAAA